MSKTLKVLWLAIFLFPSLAFAQQNYVSNNFRALAQEHQLLAILPFDIRLQLPIRESLQLTDEQFQQMTLEQSSQMQRAIAEEFNRRKIKKGFQVSFQSIESTNNLLKQKNITPENIGTFSRKELAQVLGVDGIVFGSISIDQVLSQDQALFFAIGGYFPPVQFSNMIIKVADAKEGEVLWSYLTGRGSSLIGYRNAQVYSLARRASRKFPYKKL